MMVAEKTEKSFYTWEILRKGNYYNGQITDEMLEEITKNFGKNGDIPIGIGHMNSFFDDSLPAEGWITNKKDFGISDKKAFVAKGVSLFEPLKSQYEEGRYKNWSAVIARPRIYDEKSQSYVFGTWELRAVDLLGRATPAIKNLKDMTAGKEIDLSKYSFDEKNHNIMKFNDNGNELEIMCFSLSGEIEIKEHSEDTTNISKENITMDEKIFNEMKAKAEETERQLSQLKAEKEANEKRFAAEKEILQSKADEVLKKFTAGEKEKLDASLKRIPKELKEKLFSALDATVQSNIEMTFGAETEEKKSVYGILADVFNQINFSSDDSYFSDAPERFKNEGENEKVYSDGMKAVKAIC